MSKERIYLFDTTLRDGQQTPGIDFSVEDKIAIARMLDEFGIDYVEGGYPGANPTDTAFFAEKRTETASFVAFGMTKRAGVSTSNDPGLAGLIQAESDAVCLVAKAWDYHVKVALGCTNEENLESISDSVKAVTEAGKEAMVDCEHFFDGYKANPAYAIACAKRPTRQAHAGSCCATPMGVPSLRRSATSSASSLTPESPATGLASMPTTTPARQWPIRWPPWRPVCGRSRARSTASASVAAMPTWSR
jgi:isopropylmalate/homocitrate/citramalate synthase